MITIKSRLRKLHEMSHSPLQVCMVCLDTDTKLYLLSEYNLEQMYTNIIGYELHSRMPLDPSLCAECAQRLINFSRFQEKGQRAHNLLLDLIEKHKIITVQNIKMINRVNNRLKSGLVKKILEPNHYDLILESTSEEKKAELGKQNNAKHVEQNTVDEPYEETVNKDKCCHVMNHISDSSREFVIDTDTDDNLIDVQKNNRFLGGNDFDDELSNADKEFLNNDRRNYGDGKSINHFKESNKSKLENKIFVANDVVNKILIDSNRKEKSILNKVEMAAVTNKVDKKIVLDKVKNKVGKKVSIRNKYKNSNKVKNMSRHVLNKDISKTNKAKDMSKHVFNKAICKTDVKTKKLLSDDLKMFTVSTLSYEEQVADVRKRQETPNYKNSEYKCSICCKGFSNKHTYNGHMEKHTNKFGELECAICGLHFKYRVRLRHHINNNHAMRYTCTSCSYVAKQKFSAYLHEQWHKGTKYLCPHCEEQFIRLTTYLSHLRIKHPSDFVCTLCGYSFVSQKGMSLHMKLKHRFENLQNQSGPICEFCDIHFATDTAYAQHLKVSPKHSCDGDRTRNDSYIWSHNFRGGHHKRSIKPRTDSGQRKTEVRENIERHEEQVVCEQCGVQQKDFRSYGHHFRKAHPDKNRTKYAPRRRHCLCEHCGKFLPNPTLLKYHMSIHVGVRGFQCDVCDKKFVLKTGLAIHMKTHSDTRVRYECPVCGKSFTTLANRSRHEALHSGVKPFKCDFCDKTFATAAEKTLHTSHVHLKKPWPKRERGPRPKGSKGDSRRVRPISAYVQYETHKSMFNRSVQDK